MRDLPPIPPHVVEAANRFRLGDRVEIDRANSGDWIEDWIGTEGEIVGVVLNPPDRVNITIRHDGDQITDGFQPADFRLVSRRGRAE